MGRDDTNATILAEVRSVKAMVINQGKQLKKHGDQIGALEKTNELAQFAKQAVDEYKKTEADQSRQKDKDDYNRTKLKLLRDLAPFIVAGIALAYALLSRH